MTKHSQAFESKKNELEKAEAELRKAIDTESENLENSALQYLKVAAAISTAVLVTYGIYRLTIKSNAPEKKEKKTSNEPSMMDKVVDKVTDVVAGLAVQKISNYLDKLRSGVEKDLKR